VAAQLNASKPLSIVFAIPDHPWYLGGDMAAVRISMTVGVAGKQEGQVFRVVDPRRNAARGGDELLPPLHGIIVPSLSVGVDIDSAQPLRANEGLCRQGVKLGASGFILSGEQAKRLNPDATSADRLIIRSYLRNKDITGKPRDTFVIDLYGFSEQESLKFCPRIYDFLINHVKLERQQSRRKAYREKWWIFVEPRPDLRRAMADLHRYVVTPEVAKFRPFVFVDGSVLPDASLYVIATIDAYVLGVLSSSIHRSWVLAPGRGGNPRKPTTLP
jgi:hypothetical protein